LIRAANDILKEQEGFIDSPIILFVLYSNLHNNNKLHSKAYKCHKFDENYENKQAPSPQLEWESVRV
jgi:hypothetical protein